MIYVVPTIDVEGVHGARPFDELVLGDLGGRQSWGVYKLANILLKHDLSATFFVDVYEYTLWGEKRLADMCKRLADMGQDVQLHTHPGWREDQRDPEWLRKLKRDKSYLGHEKDFMAKLSVAEQTAVLEHGVELFIKWLGHPPVCHRSGGYSINEDTLSALRQVGITIDSSMNATHQNSKVTWSKNAIVRKNGITELPVTFGRFQAGLGFGGARWSFFEKNMKTDLDFFSLEELKEYVRNAREMNLRLCNLFMHSYSLIKLTNGFHKLSPDANDAEKLDSFLGWAKREPNVIVANCTEMKGYLADLPDDFHDEDEIPLIQLRASKAVGHLYSKNRTRLMSWVDSRSGG